MAEELEKRVEKQHREQLERLKADQVRLSSWLGQYVADLKAAKRQVNLDPLEELFDDVKKFREGQEKLQESINEQISAEAMQRGLFGQEIGQTAIKKAEKPSKNLVVKDI